MSTAQNEATTPEPKVMGGGFQLADVGQLPWLPDETLFSYCSRYHRLSGGNSRTTSSRLFGHSRGGQAHDLPNRVDEFTARVRLWMTDSAERVIRSRTILPYYLPFHSGEAGAAAIQAMRGQSIGPLKFQLGLLTSGFRAHHPLRLCRQCLAHDARTHQVAYWHLAHQYPGVWLCLEHDRPLLEANVKSTGVGRFLWHLPDAQLSIDRSASHGWDTNVSLRELLREFAHGARAIASTPTTLEPHRIAQVNADRLRERGFTTLEGRVRSAAAESLSSFLSPLSVVPELAPLAIPPRVAHDRIRRLSGSPRMPGHPLHHVAMAAWLHGSWSAFFSAYEEASIASSPPAQEPSNPRRPRHSDATKSAFLALITADGRTISAATRHLGIDVKTGMIWAAKSGIEVNRRPSKLMANARKRMTEDLRSGMSKQAAAVAYQVSVQTVTSLLFTAPGVHDAWTHARTANRRGIERGRWLELVTASGQLGTKALRWMAPSTYAWLYRNDREWLAMSQPSPLPRVGNNDRTDWPARDLELSKAVTKVCMKLAREYPGKAIALWRILQWVPELRPKLRRLDRLPLTSAALERARKYPASSDSSGSLFQL